MPYTDRVDYVAAMTANHVWAEAVERLGDAGGPAARALPAGDLRRAVAHLLPLHRPGGDGHGRGGDDPVSVLPARARVRQRADRGAVRGAADLQLSPHRRRGLGSDRQLARQGAALLRSLRGDHRRVQPPGHLQPDLHPAAGQAGAGQRPTRRSAGGWWARTCARRAWPSTCAPTAPTACTTGSCPGSTGARPWAGARWALLGDAWDRLYVRVEEWRWSVRILREALDQIQETPRGQFWTPPKKLKPRGEASARVEAARGDMHCYVVGDGGRPGLPGPLPHRIVRRHRHDPARSRGG